MIQQCFGDQSLNRTQVFQWHARFKAGRTPVTRYESSFANNYRGLRSSTCGGGGGTPPFGYLCSCSSNLLFYNSVYSLMIATLRQSKHVALMCKLYVVYLADCIHFIHTYVMLNNFCCGIFLCGILMQYLPNTFFEFICTLVLSLVVCIIQHFRFFFPVAPRSHLLCTVATLLHLQPSSIMCRPSRPFAK